MNFPAFPLIAFTRVSSVKVYHRHNDLLEVKLSDFMYQTPHQFAFDSHGNKWCFQIEEPPFQVGFWTELRNPVFKAVISWKKQERYHLEQLKDELYKLLEKDDEVLTEYESAGYLKSLLSKCSSFESILKTLNRHVFQVNETELWREQESRNHS